MGHISSETKLNDAIRRSDLVCYYTMIIKVLRTSSKSRIYEQRMPGCAWNSVRKIGRRLEIMLMFRKVLLKSFGNNSKLQAREEPLSKFLDKEPAEANCSITALLARYGLF